MKINTLAIFHSIPEALTYGLLIVLLILNIIGLGVSADNAQKAKVAADQVKALAAQNQMLAADNQNNTKQIENQLNCISLYFAQTDRASLTIDNLNNCSIKR
jgi:hypothetical protein